MNVCCFRQGFLPRRCWTFRLRTATGSASASSASPLVTILSKQHCHKLLVPCHAQRNCTSITTPNSVFGVAHRTLRQLCLQAQQQHRNQARLFSKLPFEVNANVPNNVLIFSYKNDKFQKLISYFGVTQLVFWAYLSVFALLSLKDAPKTEDTGVTGDLPWFKKLLNLEGKYKNALSFIFLAIGGGIFGISALYPHRAVRSMWLLKGGNSVEITTYSWLGRTRTFSTPTNHIDCLKARSDQASQIPLRVKGRHFYFLMDREGKFHNQELFDFVIGLKRDFK